ncbi:RDD family protein [Streptomyces sp. NPDC047725]|uniref:RDD family protein n=1 Tax=Streptomyces sp. NPDC047725 TaxID=3365487 RepID=UPI003721980C
MSAPTPAPGDDRPREGYYPDPSIPGYVRYWNGASWVAGTSRPAPKDGEPLAPPPGVRPAVRTPAPSVEETGPHFFDEDPVEEPPAGPASRPEAAPAWGTEPARVTWPDAQGQGQDPRVPHPSASGGAAAAQSPGPHAGTASAPAAPGGTDPAHAASATGAPAAASGTDPAPGGSPGGQTAPHGPVPSPAAAPPAPGHAGTASAPPASGGSGPAHRRPPAGQGPAASADADGGAGSTFVFRRPTAADGPADEGTMTFRTVPPRASGAGKAAPARPAPAAAPTAPSGPQQAAAPDAAAVPHQAAAPQPSAAAPHQGAAPRPAAAVPHQAAAPQPLPAAVPPQQAVPAPVAAGPGGGQASWAQQVHRLAGSGADEQPVAPWKPPVDDVFQAAARRQAAARPAGVGKRLAARLIDTVVLAAVTAVAAVPLGTRALDHVNDKIDQARLSGETVTVWLIDGTTGTCLGIVLAVLLLFGVVYEALPTAKWGRTLGKKLLGLEVRDIEAHEPPSFGAALRRWLVYSVPGLLAVGIVGVAWCLFDRPWHQCWHDKAARTFVAG